MPALVTAAVDVWLVDLTQGDRADEALPVARRRSARTRAALCARLGVPGTALARTPHGKPYLPGSSRRFSVSHSRALGVVALADGVEVGVDVEALDGPRRRRVLPGVLAAGERARVERASDPVTEFLRCWTRKEALLKGLGCGLRVDLEEVAIDPAGPGRFAPSALPGGLGDPGAWTVVDLDLDGYAGAVAAAAGAISVTVATADCGEEVEGP